MAQFSLVYVCSEVNWFGAVFQRLLDMWNFEPEAHEEIRLLTEQSLEIHHCQYSEGKVRSLSFYAILLLFSLSMMC